MSDWKSRIIGSGTEDPTQLVANPKNWRIHPKAQQDSLADVLERVGWVQQIIVNKVTGNVVDGHLRVELAISRNESSVPVVYVELDPSEEALILATLDPLASMAATDDAKLRELLAEVQVTDDLEKLLADMAGSEPAEGLTDADDAPQPPNDADVYVKPGELYILGTHRLLCGDSTDSEAVARLMDGEKAAAVLTDPPYGIDHEGIANDDPAGLRLLYDGVLSALPVTDAVVAAFHSPRMFPVWLDATRESGLSFERMLWLHRAASKTYPWRGWVMASDAILLSSVGRPDWPKPKDWVHDTYEKTKLEDASLTGSHTTIKPVAVFSDILGRLPRGLCYEPFAGSGTTIIAAEQTGRRCYAMELEPKYVQVAKERWEAFTGKEAVLDGSSLEADA